MKPEPRYQAGMVYDSKRDRLLLFGGTGTATYDDLWSWSPTTSEWTQITVIGRAPDARVTASGCSTTRPATRCTCSGRTRAATRSGSTIRR